MQHRKSVKTNPDTIHLGIRFFQKLCHVLLIIIFLTLVHCESENRIYRPNLPEKLCTIGIIDADDTIGFDIHNPYTINNFLRYISFEKSFQSEYPGEQDDSLRKLSFSISSRNEEMFSYHCDSSLKNLESYKLPANLDFKSGEKYFLKACTEGVEDISSEINVPVPPSNLIVNSVHKETEPATQKPGCHFELDDSIKYAVIDLSFDIEAESYYAILLEGTGFGANGLLFRGFVDFSVINNNVQGFKAILYGLKMPHLNCTGNINRLTHSAVKAFFIDNNTISGERCNITLSAKFNDSYSPFYIFTSFRIKLLSIPEEFYLFEKRLYTYEKVVEDPFSEPVFLNGNIKNGNGIFAICRSTEVSVILPFPPIF